MKSAGQYSHRGFYHLQARPTPVPHQIRANTLAVGFDVIVKRIPKSCESRADFHSSNSDASGFPVSEANANVRHPAPAETDGELQAFETGVRPAASLPNNCAALQITLCGWLFGYGRVISTPAV